MSFQPGDLCQGVDDYGRPIAGIADSAGLGGYVTLTPFPTMSGGKMVQPGSITVRASTCQVIEPLQSLVRSQALRDQEQAGRVATWRRDEVLEARAREIDAQLASVGQDRAPDR